MVMGTSCVAVDSSSLDDCNMGVVSEVVSLGTVPAEIPQGLYRRR